ncbi:MAG: class I adenylate cyclase [Pseudomonas sp.]|nr:class I adenylate cyclase [Pseudomonas sp.]
MVEICLDIEDGIDRKDLSRLRNRFLSVNRDRLLRANLTQSTRQQFVLRLMPLLLHVNHPLLPGYVSGTTPSGLSAYEPSAELIQDAQSLARSFVYKPPRGYQVVQSLHGLFLMGSLGSVAYAENSDMDFWLCHSADLTVRELQALRKKCDLLQEWAASLGAKIYLFLIEPQQFAHGSGDEKQLSLDDCGTTQHYLLLDEFYRTAIWLAGRTPLWWWVPAHEEYRYAEYCQILLAKRFVRSEDVLDLGCVAHIPANEFVGAGMWQLYKGIESPYKSLLKLLLIEVYAAELPHVECLSLSFKRAIYANQTNSDDVDAYVMLYRRLEAYLLERDELERLELVRRCFYLKVGKRLTQSRTYREKSWQRLLLEKLTQSWGWSEALLRNLDYRNQWKIAQTQQERRLLVNELMYSYRFLSQLARQMQVMQAVNARDLAVLGRRLYAAFERKAGKVEYLNPGIAPDLSEDTLTLVQCVNDESEQTSWGVFRGSLTGQEWQDHSALKRAKELLSVLAWAHLNGVIDESSRLSLITHGSDLSELELQGILKSLRRTLSLPFAAVDEDTLLASSYPQRVLLLVNVGIDPLPKHSQANVHMASEQVDALGFSGLRENLVLSIDQVTLNSWNELLVSRYTGASALLQCLTTLLNESAGHAAMPLIQVSCFCRNRAASIVQRVEQVVEQVFSSAYLTHDSRYLLQIEQQYHVLEWRAGRAGYMSFTDAAELTEYLAQEQAHYIRWRVDEYALQGHVLKFILPVGRADALQVFYRVHAQQAQLYVLDERNGLWQHSQPFVDEQTLLMPLQRFLSSLLYRQTITESFTAEQPTVAPLSINYHRIYPDGTGSPQLLERRQWRDNTLEHTFYAVQVIYEEDGTQTLYCNHQEFSELEYGAKLYHYVARYILGMRRTAERYPCYITDIDLSKVLPHDSVQTMHFLQRKTILEKRLNEALQKL